MRRYYAGARRALCPSEVVDAADTATEMKMPEHACGHSGAKMALSGGCPQKRGWPVRTNPLFVIGESFASSASVCKAGRCQAARLRGVPEPGLLRFSSSYRCRLCWRSPG